MNKFEYIRPATVSDAVAAAAEPAPPISRPAPICST